MPVLLHNKVAALSIQRQLYEAHTSSQSAIQRLSTGLKVNSARDDAAGLAIADRMTAQVRGMSVAVRNANAAISMIETVDAASGL